MTILQSPSHSASFNLAAEEYLFTHRTDDILFLYVNEPCVVVGRNQDVLSEVNADFCKSHKIPVFKRMSGGGTVYHDLGNLNYCFISNRMKGEAPLKDDFLKPLVTVLAGLGVEVLIGKRNDLWLPGGYKVSGTASHVGKLRMLQHGTLLYDSNLIHLGKCLTPDSVFLKSRAIASVPSPVRNIRSYLKDGNSVVPEANCFFGWLTERLATFYGLDSVAELSPDEMALIIPHIPVVLA